MTTEEHERRLAVEAWLRRKYVVRTNRGIDYMEAAVDDLAKEIERYMTATAPQGDAGEVAELLLENWANECGGVRIAPRYISDLKLAIAAALTQREQAARTQERERCAKAVEGFDGWLGGHDSRANLAAAIRNPGQVE